MAHRIGILGGSFDPIHYGHLAIAEDARIALHLDQVLFVPAGVQPLKAGLLVASAHHRLAMTTLATADNPAFAVSTIEIDRPGPSYTATTLEALHAAHQAELHFILGADALVDLPRWRDVRRLLELAHLVAVARPGYTPDLVLLVRAVPGIAARLTLLDGPQVDVSSTALRRRIADGRPIRYQTPDAVVAYIADHQLYAAAR